MDVGTEEKTSKQLQQELKNLERQMEKVAREKGDLQREHNKSLLMRDKLQEICRKNYQIIKEQQKIINSVKNESVLKLKEEEERRKESQAKFQAALDDIQLSLANNSEENLKLRDHNIEMTEKLKFLAEQYNTREQQLEKMNEQIEIKSQLHTAQLNKVKVEAAMEKEILIKEKQIVMEKLLQSQKLLHEFHEREAALKEQLNLYTSKYDDFQSSLQKSNNIFVTYKAEIEKMSKNTKKLEKDALEWKRKWEKSNATLIGLATEKQERDEHAQRCNKQVDQLQKLLRVLQHERGNLYSLLRENNIEIPALPVLPPEPEPLKTAPITSVSDRDKIEMMSRNCVELKETLANLQSQMKVLNLKGTTDTDTQSSTKTQEKSTQPAEESTKKRQKKKQKSKSKNVKESTPPATTTTKPTLKSVVEQETKIESNGLKQNDEELHNENIDVNLVPNDVNDVDGAVDITAIIEAGSSTTDVDIQSQPAETLKLIATTSAVDETIPTSTTSDSVTEPAVIGDAHVSKPIAETTTPPNEPLNLINAQLDIDSPATSNDVLEIETQETALSTELVAN